MSQNAKERSPTTCLNSASRLGIVVDFVIGTSDVDATVDPDDNTQILGPMRDFRVLAGTGVLVYEDDVNGTTHTLGSAVALQEGDEITDMAIRTIHGTGNDDPSGALTLRARW